MRIWDEDPGWGGAKVDAQEKWEQASKEREGTERVKQEGKQASTDLRHERNEYERLSRGVKAKRHHQRAQHITNQTGETETSRQE